MDDNFALGLVVGSVTSVIIAVFVGFVSGHWGTFTAIWSPQTITLTTDQTPWQVLVNGCRSLLILIILITLILVGIFLFGAASIFGWERVMTFVMSVAQLQ
jgi:hypothetical protein